MAQHSVVVRPGYGLHMRPAHQIARCAELYDADVVIAAPNGRIADAKSLLEICTLGTCSGMTLTVSSIDAAAASAVACQLKRACVPLAHAQCA